MIVQTISALLGVAITALLFAPEAPSGVYVIAGLASGCAGAWLWARLKYGRGVTVHPSRRID